MNECRNCGGSLVRDLGSIGEVAPFFLKRVFGIDLGWQQSPHGLKKFVRTSASTLHDLVSKIAAPRALLAMQICKTCSFVQTALALPEEGINRLYQDYRNESYNRERIAAEPSYAAVAPNIGRNPQEIEGRVNAMMHFLNRHIDVSSITSILDFGGADGKYLARYNAPKFVYEISTIAPVEGVTRVRSREELATYSLVQVAHVIEHVVHPLNLIRQVAATVAPHGYLYLETPQDSPSQILQDFQEGKIHRRLTVHEHINQYSADSVAKLIEAGGLAVVAVEVTEVDMGWVKAIHVRGLGRNI